jgi:hypothetical protein
LVSFLSVPFPRPTIGSESPAYWRYALSGGQSPDTRLHCSLFPVPCCLELHQSQSSLAGLYDGNPKRSTHRPTAEKLLRAFCNITLSKHRDGSQEILGLNMLQKQILSLMKVPENIYTNLANDSG